MCTCAVAVAVVGPQITFLPYRGGIPVRYKAIVPQSGAFGDLMQWFAVRGRSRRRDVTLDCTCTRRRVTGGVVNYGWWNEVALVEWVGCLCVGALTDGVGTAGYGAVDRRRVQLHSIPFLPSQPAIE